MSGYPCKIKTMYCAKCGKNVVNYNCSGADERLASLLKCQHLDPRMIERIQAERHLNKFERQAQVEEQTKIEP
jgi:hypothetical protein